MTRRLTLVLAALFLSLTASAVDRTTWKLISPGDGAHRVKVEISSKPAGYWALEKDGVSLKLTGPTKLRISLRAHFAKDDPASLSTTLTVTRDGANAQTRKFSSMRSTTATFPGVTDGSAPGGRDRWTIDVPEGEHTLKVTSDRPACGSFARIGKRKKILRTEMTPATFAKALPEVSKERERTWYVAEPEKPVALDVVGPTRLRIEASLNFDAGMRGDIPWTATAKVGEAPAVSKEFKSARSQVRSYPEEKELVPGREVSFDIEVPAGTHRVTLSAAGLRSAAFRVLIPTRDLNNRTK